MKTLGNKLYPQKAWLGLLSVLMLIATVSSGCRFKAPTFEDANADRTVWSLEPVQMRVFPGTRFISVPEESEHPILEVAVEFFDDMGDSVKAIGNLRIELHYGNSPRNASTGSRLYNWDIPMLGRTAQEVHYDSVIRGYQFRLALENDEPLDQPTFVRAFFECNTNTRLQATNSIRDER